MSSETLAGLYCAHLEELKARLAVVRRVAAGGLNAGSEALNYKIAAVNLRKSLELIAFASMTANKDAYSSVHANFQKHWNAKRLLADLERIHPEFYPKAVYVAKESPGPPRHLHFDFVETGFLSREEFVTLYDNTSRVIHTVNPFAASRKINFGHSVTEWADRIERLLSLHLMRLSGSPEIWLVRLTDESGRIHASIASPTGGDIMTRAGGKDSAAESSA